MLVQLTLYLPVMKIAESANSVDLDEVAHNEPPHSRSTLFVLYSLIFKFSIFADVNFVICFLVVKGYRWMDDLRFYVFFNSIPVISGQCLDDNERLCAVELRRRLHLR